MSIYVTGDTHGERGRIEKFDEVLTKDDYIIICGDWGYLFRNSSYETTFLDELEARPYTVLFIDGNHENFPAIYAYPEEVWNGGRVHRIRKNIFHLCRGQIFNICNKTFFTFGGGYSIDRAFRTAGKDWWEEEMPIYEEYDEGKLNLEECSWKVDYILTHTLNVESIRVLAAMNRYSEVKPLCIDEAPMNFYLEEIRARVKYDRWFFGHFHLDKEIPYTRQRGLWFEILKLV